ncbi:MAG TPA: ATP-binding protein [Pyrinomonadaceae bacterium]|nr:ATP-binding protein [Pyrinomonadaceae bacterium]
MAASKKKSELVTFTPRLRGADAVANYWMRQATLRLRREVSWCWSERGAGTPQTVAALPPFADRASASLDLSRFWEEKQRFYLTDATARYLTEQLNVAPPDVGGGARGSFAWVVAELELDDAASFTLALALTTALDASMGSVIASCLNDQTRTHPNLALAQKLWDAPEEILALADPAHALFARGLLVRSRAEAARAAETEWDAPLTVPSVVARQLLFPDAPLPSGLTPLEEKSRDGDALAETSRLVALRLADEDAGTLRVVPVLGPKGAARRGTVATVARASGRGAVELEARASDAEDLPYLNSLATLCWLRDLCLFIAREPSAHDGQHGSQNFLPAATIPAILFVAASERAQVASVPDELQLPAVNAPVYDYAERVAHWKRALGAKARGLDSTIAEAARRFRYERETIDAVAEGLKRLPRRIDGEEFFAACRAELAEDIGELASRVAPRFEGEELILPRKQHLQFEEHLRAMRALTEVHYRWGTARVWNESGISVLFAGAPGTGKTMAAEILALKLDLPMYRIDLSQVVNKYIGETEKNLKRLFDAADISDVILFFDEADALFGKRSEVKDSHDRYANLEISYLLERMERFKGLAILATNRKKDLDEAFLRRLRYVIDFPLPGERERLRIWRQMIPAGVDASELDFDFLARQFQLAGGHIRSIIFNACLQSADGGEARLSMREVVIAIKREYDKLNRPAGLEQYGPYASFVEELEHEREAALTR